MRFINGVLNFIMAILGLCFMFLTPLFIDTEQRYVIAVGIFSGIAMIVLAAVRQRYLD